MSLLNEILEFNEQFVEEGEYVKYTTDKYPEKRMVIISCMDTRLVELLPKSMNVKNGDVKILKTAGAIVSHPFGSVMRSILVAIYELKADEVFVIPHHDCGMASVDADSVVEKMIDRDIPKSTIDTLGAAGIDIRSWLRGFDDVYESVKKSVEVIKGHPLIPKNIPVHGLIISPDTGKLELVVDGYAVEENQ
ncbi:beta-class carbonic anhydrase [Peribacillus butanolivorans]|jgi:carbonic anhydrase|uniref:beta-class carbonic anhydrase n=1 Tax=Peribacillus TaxID=2675229 RepID=UPI0006A71D33|nr:MULTISPECIES: carbonic anhydrase [Peribacillus]KON69680.1 carbonic anhydrase [Peribacillus butanolivorans]MBK5442091.1 carbonic anhydrase [Peribacillus sp. TH24]MBK5463134.1 carbonic anhydrase [Peribacillus sp. TH27]MBK5501341.1 carbonic anhydrase [Peribacillus sp. TH14]MCO0599773.1 carbonic anhydrase [Peribacillus butanolivorans]